MNKRVLEIVTENLTNERLDSIAHSIEEYVQAEQEAGRKLSALEKMLGKEQQRELDSYLSAENHWSAVYTEISYKQGMKDIVNLVMELIDG